MVKKPKRSAVVHLNKTGRRIDPGVTLFHERLVGRMVIAWGLLEAAMQDCIWHILKVPMGDGRIITARRDAKTKLEWLRSFSKKHFEGEPLELLTKTLDLIELRQDDRNFIMHGVWGTLMPDNEPSAASFRAKSAPDEVISETFSEARMRQIINDIHSAKDDIRAWMSWLESSRGKQPQQ
jgi:hypothetical protein